MTRDKHPERIRPMKRKDFVDAKAYIHRPVALQDAVTANSYARRLIREVERLTALVEQPVPESEAQVVLGVAEIGETPVCNGRCGIQGYGEDAHPDFDRDCPLHGDETVNIDECPEGCGTQRVADISIEASGYEEQERSYHVIFLECGHDISWPVGTARVVDIDTGGLI